MLFSAILNTWVCYRCGIPFLGKSLLWVSIFALEALRVQSFICHSREASSMSSMTSMTSTFYVHLKRSTLGCYKKSPLKDPLAQLQLPKFGSSKNLKWEMIRHELGMIWTQKSLGLHWSRSWSVLQFSGQPDRCSGPRVFRSFDSLHSFHSTFENAGSFAGRDT